MEEFIKLLQIILPRHQNFKRKGSRRRLRISEVKIGNI